MTGTGRSSSAASLKATGPHLLADLLVRVREGGRLPELSGLLLAGHLPSSSASGWAFRTRLNVFANPPALAAAGLSLDMVCWPLRAPPGLPGFVRRDVRVGRAPSNDVVLDHPDVSKLHARFTFDGDQVFVQDASSSNQTFLNGAAVPARIGTPLRAGDTLAFASVTLVVASAIDVMAMLAPG